MADSGQYFDRLAPFYDEIIEARHDGEEDYSSEKLGFYVDQGRRADGPVLELGCGTGQVYLELRRNDVDAYGLDLSAAMLERLERRAEEEGLDARVRCADMRTFTPRREYDLVLIPGRVFLHNHTREEQKGALENVRDALAPGGRLVCNFFVPDFDTIRAAVSGSRTEEFSYDGETYQLHIDTDVDDGLNRLVRSERRIEDDSGTVVDELEGTLRLVSRDEFALLLETTGYSSWDVYGGFDLEPLTSPDQEMVWVATA